MKTATELEPTPTELLGNVIAYWKGEARRWASLGDKIGERVALDCAKAFEMEQQTGRPHCCCHHEPLDAAGFCAHSG